jgi:hypothetical protein
MIECITSGLKGDRPIFLYFDDTGDAVTFLARLRALGCAEGPLGGTPTGPRAGDT